jgi:hypothetical protein
MDNMQTMVLEGIQFDTLSACLASVPEVIQHLQAEVMDKTIQIWGSCSVFHQAILNQ